MYKNIKILGTIVSIIAGTISVCILRDDYKKANGSPHH